MQEQTDFKFPKDFLWGASLSAHQSEGGNHNQWTVWERDHADEYARTAKDRLSGLPGWKNFSKEAQTPANYISGKGIDHYNLYKKDFDIAKKLNLNTMRVGIEWSRIEPKEGVWDLDEIEHYKNYLGELKKRGIEPMLTLWHWTVPVWFADKGGFLKRRNLKYFERFVHKVGQELIADVRYVLTLNEPNVYASFGYLAPEPNTGPWPPNDHGLLKFGRVYRNLTLAHRRAYYILKHQKPGLQISLASQLANIQAKRPHNFYDELVTEFMRYFWNWWFLRRVRREQDFIGVNYYFSDYYRFALPFKIDDPKVPLSDVGSYMEPEGIYPLLLRIWAHYGKPIIVTEGGLADSQDEYRRWYIEETIVAIERALSEGVDVRGYMHWSLLDNFEWSYGWWPKFGLVSVDRKHGMKRQIRPSAKWYAQRIKNLSS